MARTCDICEKKSLKGNKITLIWGVKYRSIRHREPNLRKVPLIIDGKRVQSKICAKCLKNVKRDKVPHISAISYVSKDAKEKVAAVSKEVSKKTKVEIKSKTKTKKEHPAITRTKIKTNKQKTPVKSKTTAN